MNWNKKSFGMINTGTPAEKPVISATPDAAPTEWMDVSECAENLGISGNTMRRILRQDEVPVLRLSKKIRVRRSDFAKLLERRITAL